MLTKRQLPARPVVASRLPLTVNNSFLFRVVGVCGPCSFFLFFYTMPAPPQCSACRRVPADGTDKYGKAVCDACAQAWFQQQPDNFRQYLHSHGHVLHGRLKLSPFTKPPRLAHLSRGDALAAIKTHAYNFCSIPNNLQQDKEVVLVAMRQNGKQLRFVPDHLRRDRSVVQAAVETHGDALQYANGDLSADLGIVLAAVRQNGFAICCAHKSLSHDRTIALAAVRQNGAALRCLPPALRADREIVLAAVRRCGLMLWAASRDLRADPEVVAAAVSADSDAAKYAVAKCS
jgi:hypothetical protein